MVYIARDGKEFDCYDACHRYELCLAKDEMQGYLNDNCLEHWCDSWGGLPGFLNLGGNTMYLVVVDDRIVEWSKGVCREDLSKHIGEPVFLSTNEWANEEWFFDGSISEVIDNLRQTATWLSDVATDVKNGTL